MVRLATLIATLALVASASADRWAPTDVVKAITVADNHWPDSGCYGQHHIQWVGNVPFNPVVLGLADVGPTSGCHVWVYWRNYSAATYSGQLRELCAVLTHEFGHNAGFTHSTNTWDVMNGIVLVTPPECTATFKKRGRYG